MPQPLWLFIGFYHTAILKLIDSFWKALGGVWKASESILFDIGKSAQPSNMLSEKNICRRPSHLQQRISLSLAKVNMIAIERFCASKVHDFDHWRDLHLLYYNNEHKHHHNQHQLQKAHNPIL